MRFAYLNNERKIGKLVAKYIAQKIRMANPSESKPFVLGLPTGSTPLMTYQELISLYQKGEVSFKHVVTFNMDEYVGLPPDHPQSYNYFMFSNLFSHVNMDKENIHIPDGTAKDPQQVCRSYEEQIKKVGGIDLFLGGVGSNGHIAFNEPGSSLQSRMRVISLAEETILQNARFFENRSDLVPKKAYTIGIQTLMDAKEVVIIALGAKKALAVKEAVEGHVTQLWPVTALQFHPKVFLFADEEASLELRWRTLRYYDRIEDDISEITHEINAQ